MSEQPNPGDTIKITGTFDINLNLPPDIKIYVEKVETLPTPIEGFDIEGGESVQHRMIEGSTINLIADYSEAPDDFVVTWVSDSPEAVLVEDDGIGHAAFALTDNPGAQIDRIDITATGSSVSTGQVSSSSIEVEKVNTIGTIGDVSMSSPQGSNISNGGFAFINVTNNGTANPTSLNYMWTSSDPSAVIGGTENPVGSGQYFTTTPANSVVFGTNDSVQEVAVLVSNENAYDVANAASLSFTIGNGSTPVQTIGDVTVSTPPGQIDNFTTKTFTATYSGSVATAFYNWSCSTDPQAIISTSGNTADITFQNPDQENIVTCEITNSLAADSPRQGSIGVTVGNPGGYVPVEGSILTAGSGWTGVTPTPAALGNSNDLGYDYQPAARWATKMYESHVQGDGIVSHYVVASHPSGIAHVDFSLNDGQFVRVTEKTYVPYYDADLYVISVDVDQLPEADDYEIRAIAVPNGGQPRVLQGEAEWAFPPFPDENGEGFQSDVLRGMFGMRFHKIPASKRKIVFVDNVNGIDSTDSNITDGTEEKPYKTISDATYFGLCDGINGSDLSACTVLLLPSAEPYVLTNMGWPRSSLNTKSEGWFTIASADSTQPVTMSAPSSSESGSIAQGINHIRIKDVVFNYENLESGKRIIPGKNERNVLVEDCTYVSEFAAGGVFGTCKGWSGHFNCSATNVLWGPYGKGTVVNCSINGLLNDAYVFSCGFRNSCEFSGNFVPGYDPSAHQDQWQVFYNPSGAIGVMDNYVMHGYEAVERIATQGILLSGGTEEFRSFYIAKSRIDIRDSTNGVPNPSGVSGGALNNYYIFADTRGFVVENCEFSNGFIYSPEMDVYDPVWNPDGTGVPGENGTYTGEDTLFHNVSYIDSIEPFFPYPDRLGGNGLGGFYEKDGNPPFPWKSPSTLVTYTSDVWQDYLLEARITENSIVVPAANEITPATKTLKAQPVSDQDNFTYQWNVTASDGDLSAVTTTSGTSETFVFEVSTGSNTRVYTVSLSIYSPDLDITQDVSVTYKVRPPVNFPVTFGGDIPDGGGNNYQLYASDLGNVTWTDNSGENVLPDAFIQLRIRSYVNGVSFYFNNYDEMINRFLGEYAGKNITLVFDGEPPATLNGPLQVGTIGDPGVNCEIKTRSSDNAPYLNMPSAVWSGIPYTGSNGSTKPFTITFTTP